MGAAFAAAPWQGPASQGSSLQWVSVGMAVALEKTRQLKADILINVKTESCGTLSF